jgi:hypothetical protein
MLSSVYGLESSSIDEAKEVIERSLGVRFSAHESLYHGGAYYRYQQGRTEIILQLNYDLLDKSPAEPEAGELPLLVYIDGDDDAAALEFRLRQMPTARLIHRRTDDIST